VAQLSCTETSFSLKVKLAYHEFDRLKTTSSLIPLPSSMLWRKNSLFGEINSLFA
jgi:hypothetical protein